MVSGLKDGSSNVQKATEVRKKVVDKKAVDDKRKTVAQEKAQQKAVITAATEKIVDERLAAERAAIEEEVVERAAIEKAAERSQAEQHYFHVQDDENEEKTPEAMQARVEREFVEKKEARERYFTAFFTYRIRACLKAGPTIKWANSILNSEREDELWWKNQFDIDQLLLAIHFAMDKNGFEEDYFSSIFA